MRCMTVFLAVCVPRVSVGIDANRDAEMAECTTGRRRVVDALMVTVEKPVKHNVLTTVCTIAKTRSVTALMDSTGIDANWAVGMAEF